MSKQISLTLRDETLRRAELFARRSGQDVADVLTDAIEVQLDPLGSGDCDSQSMRDLSDEDVLTAADGMMDHVRDTRLSELLAKQREGILVSGEQAELRALMHIYQEGLLAKSAGVAEAVRRGLRQAPKP
jgi:hypothetical protein